MFLSTDPPQQHSHIVPSPVDTEFQGFTSVDAKLAEDCGKYYADPVGWVNWAFDWGHGELEGFNGLDSWQHDMLTNIGEAIKQNNFNGVDPVKPILDATASGHGIGKSALTAMLILFIMSTRPHAKGVVTANTSDQLRTKTWAELGKWRKRCIVGHWFEYNAGTSSMNMYHRSWPESWRVDGQTCKEEKSESFAGLHAANSTPFYIFDEASAVPDIIWEVAMGGLTDGEPMFFCFGNPTRNSGNFRKCFFDNSRWNTRQIDSRTASRTNKEEIQAWQDEYGDDSDFFRVRVKGQFPRAGDQQFIPTDLVTESMKLPVPKYLGTDPLICGFDVARGGDDNCMIVFRRGKDARSEQSYKITGEVSRDSMRVISIVSELLDRHKPDATFIDVTGIGGPLGDRLRQLGYHVIDVGFGHEPDNKELYKDKNSEMGYRLKQWLLGGGVLPKHPQLEDELCLREFDHNDKGQLVVEPKRLMKKRLGCSPDWGDALYLTFAQIVPQLDVPRGQLDIAPVNREHLDDRVDYDPYVSDTLDYDPLDYE